MYTNEEFISNFEDELYLLIENTEVLKEDTLYKARYQGDNDLTISIYGSGITDRNFAKDPYFKIFIGKGTKPYCRIGFKDGKAKYIDHNSENGRLSKRQIEKLDKIMNKPTKGEKFKQCTVWDAILQSTIQYAKTEEEINDILSYEKPNFNKDLRKG